jgi:hypothetical protein
MKHHLAVNMKVFGQVLLKMLSLMVSILIEIEAWRNLKMNIQDVLLSKHIIYYLLMLDVKDAKQ